PLSRLLTLLLLSLFFYRSGHHRVLHSFPTRRSSDLSLFRSLPARRGSLPDRSAIPPFRRRAPGRLLVGGRGLILSPSLCGGSGICIYQGNGGFPLVLAA